MDGSVGKVQFVVRTIELARQVIAIAESDASWGIKYELIFSKDLYTAIASRYPLRDLYGYVDPDGSYEDDVLAFANVCRRLVDDLQIVRTALDRGFLVNGVAKD